MLINATGSKVKVISRSKVKISPTCAVTVCPGCKFWGKSTVIASLPVSPSDSAVSLGKY